MCWCTSAGSALPPTEAARRRQRELAAYDKYKGIKDKMRALYKR